MSELVFGLDTFGDVTQDDDGAPLPARAGDPATWSTRPCSPTELGVDFFALGEHHRADFAFRRPESCWPAIAGATERIHLGSGVTVLSSDDPVRVFQRFSTLDALSNGRAEVILGRGSFTESFPLFGYDLSDYEVLFEEKLALFAKLLEERPVTWEGTTRAALVNAEVYPKTESGHAERPGSASAARRSRSSARRTTASR